MAKMKRRMDGDGEQERQGPACEVEVKNADGSVSQCGSPTVAVWSDARDPSGWVGKRVCLHHSQIARKALKERDETQREATDWLLDRGIIRKGMSEQERVAACRAECSRIGALHPEPSRDWAPIVQSRIADGDPMPHVADTLSMAVLEQLQEGDDAQQRE